jgi:hypothetical protein
VSRIYYHQKLTGGGKGTAKLSSWEQKNESLKVAAGFNRVITRKLAGFYFYN